MGLVSDIQIYVIIYVIFQINVSENYNLHFYIISLLKFKSLFKLRNMKTKSLIYITCNGYFIKPIYIN
jgi:hypothetical protein